MILSWLLAAFGAINNVSDPVRPQSPQSQKNASTMVDKKYEFISGKPVVMLVEGNVGSGKSTFLDIMSSLPGVEVYQEPVDLWRNVGGVNLFEKMVQEPHRWTTAFQLFSSKTRTEQILSAMKSKSPVVMIERSLFSERYCFVEMLRDSGDLTQGEFSVLDRYFQRMTDSTWTGLEVDLMVYIKSDPQILLNRIGRRGRQEEEGLTLDYLKNLHEKHEDWLIQEKYPVPAPVDVLDGNGDLEEFTKIVLQWAAKTL